MLQILARHITCHSKLVQNGLDCDPNDASPSGMYFQSACCCLTWAVGQVKVDLINRKTCSPSVSTVRCGLINLLSFEKLSWHTFHQKSWQPSHKGPCHDTWNKAFSFPSFTLQQMFKGTKAVKILLSMLLQLLLISDWPELFSNTSDVILDQLRREKKGNQMIIQWIQDPSASNRIQENPGNPAVKVSPTKISFKGNVHEGSGMDLTSFGSQSVP